MKRKNTNAQKLDKHLEAIYPKLEKFLLSNSTGKKICVAVSGGPDSLALAYSLNIFSLKKGYKIYAVIIDHGVRKDSDKEAKKVKAELALKEFVKKNSKHKLAGNAQYWYAETFYIRQLYHDAAAAYLDGYQKYPESSKGPQNLLKLGVTLSELGEKDQGCQMLNGITQQYPKASQSVIQKAKYEKKKYKCPKIG